MSRTDISYCLTQSYFYRLGRSRIRDSSRDLETSLREVMSRSEREREELYTKLESLKLSNDAQVSAGAKLEEEKAVAEEKLASCQLQLQRLERQVEGRDQSLGEREEELEKLRRELKESRRGREEAEDGEREARGRERKLRGEVGRLESQLGQVEEEVVRLCVSIREKDKDLQVSFKEYLGL